MVRDPTRASVRERSPEGVTEFRQKYMCIRMERSARWRSRGPFRGAADTQSDRRPVTPPPGGGGGAESHSLHRSGR